MEARIVLLLLYLAAVLVVFPIVVLVRLGRHGNALDALRRQLGDLEDEVKNLRTALRNLPAAPAKTEEPAAQVAPLVAPPQPAVAAPITPPSPPAPVESVAPMEPTSPPLSEPPVLGGIRVLHEEPAPPPTPAPPKPPAPPPSPPPVYVRPPREPGWMDNINWEQFMGAKLFAWLGGLALFLGVAFFVKYSFEHDLIPPAVRVAIGFVIGAGLVVGGLKLDRTRYRITSQTLIATGIVSLYAVTFACRSIYHFEFFGVVPTFLLMTLITAAAFVIAVRLEAQVVAILGILGGFLTPWLLSTGVDNPAGLFTYIALLDAGLIAVALHRQWFYLVPLGAAGTAIMQVGWAQKFYAPEKTVTSMVVCLGFSVLFLAAVEAARRFKRSSPLLARTAVVLPVVAFGFAWYFLGFPAAAARTTLFFSFVILASLALFALAWREAMGGLIAGAAAVTAALMIRWAAETFTATQAPTVVAVCLVFCAIYFAAYLLARRCERATEAVLWSAIGLPAVAVAFAFYLLGNDAVGARAGLLFSFVLAADAFLLAVAWLDERVPQLHLMAGFAVFAFLSVWTTQHLTDALLPWALAAYLLFAALHTVFPLVLERHRPAAAPTWWSQLFPPLALVLMLFPLFKLAAVSFLLWPAILLVDLFAIALAVLSASLAAVAVVLVLTLVATGVCLFKLPAAVVFAPSLLLVIGFFAVFFFAVSLWLVRKLGDRLPAAAGPLARVFGDTRAQLPAFASLLPFLLLIMACGRLQVPDPSAVFGLALLLVVLTLGLARLLVIEWLPACALAGVAGLEYAWHTGHFNVAAPALPMFWYFGFYAAFAAYPFAFQKHFARLTGPWAVAALSGIAHFPLVHRAVQLASPNDVMGLLPAGFAVPPFLSLVAILRTVPADNPKRLNQLAWLGGAALFFITLIFPISSSGNGSPWRGRSRARRCSGSSTACPIPACARPAWCCS
jgi:uncharacterized membrane protein